MADDRLTHTEGVLRVCCTDERNLEPVTVYGPQPGGVLVPGLMARECRVCGRRHYELDAEPGHLGIDIK